MTPSELQEFEKKLWDANRPAAALLAEKLFKEANLPPIVSSLPNMAAFLAKLQRQSFLHGVLAMACVLDEKLGAVKDIIQ